MKIFLISLVFSLIAGSLAGLLGGYYNDAAHPGKCVYKGEVISPGDTYFPKGQCERFVCGDDKGDGIVYSCGVQVAGSPCKLGDYLEPNNVYPKCCEREIICP